jgi:hypothetical protein
MAEQQKRNFDDIETALQQKGLKNKRPDKKTTPCKEKMNSNGQVRTNLDFNDLWENESNKHGHLKWCAAKEQCSNTDEPANEKHGCYTFKLAAHKECTTIVDHTETNGNVTQRAICAQCQYTATLSFDSDVEMATKPKSRRDRSHFIKVPENDPVQEENLVQSNRLKNNVNGDSSFTIGYDEKHELIKTISETKHLFLVDMNDQYLHAMANISSTIEAILVN